MRKPPNIYFTSDWHVGHKKVLDFDRRPFRDLDHMHEHLIKRFNHFVNPSAVTYFLGDMGWSSNNLLYSVISQLNGTKVLIRGNHDKKANSLYNAGFDVVLDKGQIMVGSQIVTMSHCPLTGVFREDTTNMRGKDGNWHNEEPFQHLYSFPDFGQFHLHGHIHAGPHNTHIKKVIDGRQYDVGVVGNNYEPVSMAKVISWIDKTIQEEKDG